MTNLIGIELNPGVVVAALILVTGLFIVRSIVVVLASGIRRLIKR
jgi:hypothetical protein